jgi:hypothetical protein
VTDNIKSLKDRADKARILYKKNLITREEAIAEIKPYIEACNKKSEAIAKKYKQRPKLLNVASYLR